MGRLNLVPVIPGLVLFICATGCSRQVDLSPDGKTLAVTDGNGVVLRDATRSRPDVKIDIPSAGSPRFSPDSSLIAIDQTYHYEGFTAQSASKPTPAPKSKPPQTTSQTVVADRSGKIKFRVKGVSGPYAWRPDGTELIGVSGKDAAVIHVKSHEIVRRYRISERPSEFLWLGNSRNIAIASLKKLTIIKDGVSKSIALAPSISTIGYDAFRNRIIWTEGVEVAKHNGYPTYEVTVRAADLDFQHPVTLLEKTRADDILDSKGRYVIPTSICLSPDGNRLAVAGIVDASKPGLMEKYATLGGFDQNSLSTARRVQLKAIEKKFVLNSVCAVTELNDKHPVATRKFERNGLDLNLQAFWTDEGSRLSVLMNDKVYAP